MLEKKIADPNLYAKDPAAFEKASTALGKIHADIEAPRKNGCASKS